MLTLVLKLLYYLTGRLEWSTGGFGLMLRWGEVLVSTATPPTVRPQHLNIPKGQVLHTEDTLQEMQKHKTGRFQ